MRAAGGARAYPRGEMTTDGRAISGRQAPSLAPPAGYLELSRGAWHSLLFVLPLIAIFEIGTALYLSEIDRTVAAFRLIAQAYQALGAYGIHLPALALVCVLLIQHVFSRASWRVRPIVPAAMVVEAAVWTAPLTIVALVLAPGPATAAAAGEAASGLDGWSWQARLTIAVGAGLYEELLFRMALIALIHFVAKDIAGMKETPAVLLALVVSTGAFVAYHDIGAGTVGLQQTAFLALAGLYFGSLYLSRGFGIAVGVHAMYDVLALLVIGRL